MIQIIRIAESHLPELARLYEELSGKPADLDAMARNFAWMKYKDLKNICNCQIHSSTGRAQG